MINDEDILIIGKINKTHGVKGELSVSFYTPQVINDLDVDDWLVMDIDGINTPFQISSLRPRGSESLLITFDGIDSQEAASAFVGKEIAIPAESLADFGDDEDDEDGMYANQLIGFKAFDENGYEIGKIVDIDTSTDNCLFIIETPTGIEYIPIVDEFITEISTENRTISFDLPEGLLQN